MRRNRGPNIGGLILFFIFFGGGIFSALAGLIGLMMPFIATFGIGYLIYRLIKSSKGESNTVKNNYNTSSKQTTVKRRVMSNADLNKIDNRLKEYFKSNINLPIIEGIALTTSGKYTEADQLYLTYYDEKIIKLGEFRNKHNDIYEKIMQLLLAFTRQPIDVMKTETEKVQPKKENILSDADKYINRIDLLNKAIPQEEITNGLYLTCDLLKKIDLIAESDSDKKKVERLYDYYLPILIEVLENYKKLQDSPVHGTDFKNSEAKLIKTIVLINEALKTLCEQMQEDDYMSLNADMSTLQSLLQKDGFGEDPFKEE